MPDIVLPEGQSPPDIINELAVSIAAASAAVVVRVHAAFPSRHTCVPTDTYMHATVCMPLVFSPTDASHANECLPLSLPPYLPTYLPTYIHTLHLFLPF